MKSLKLQSVTDASHVAPEEAQKRRYTGLRTDTGTGIVSQHTYCFQPTLGEMNNKNDWICIYELQIAEVRIYVHRK